MLAPSPEPRQKTHHGVREKVSNLVGKLDDKLQPSLATQMERRGPLARPKSPGRLRAFKGEDRPTTSTPPRIESDEHVHAEMKNPDLHLPSSTQEFLDSDAARSPARTAKPGKRTTIVTPSAPTVQADVQQSTDSRRHSYWSSDSRYSENASEGTSESDEEAGQLIAVADSGPGVPAGYAVEEEKREVAKGKKSERGHEEKPSDEQVKLAEKVMLKGETDDVKEDDELGEDEVHEVTRGRNYHNAP